MMIVENPNLPSIKTDERHTLENPPNNNLFSLLLPLLHLHFLFNRLFPLLKNHTLPTFTTLPGHLPLRSSITHPRARLLSRHSKGELILFLLLCIPWSSSFEDSDERFAGFTETGADFTEHDTCAGG